MSAQTAPEQQAQERALFAANQRFYLAFESRDIDEMSAVWAHDDLVQCVHPGWDLLMGWDEVRDRWARLFASANRVRISLSSVWMRVEGTAAWVSCTEHVTMAFPDNFEETVAHATNIFILRDARWLLVAHHASVLPFPALSTVQ